MKPDNSIFASIIFAILGCALGLSNANAKEQDFDVRVLIDVSGSMKKNDPQNLRVPALKLLVNLLPPESKAGVWIFSEDVEQLVAVGNVDEAWKRKALKASSRIHSRGLFTNIENALKSATTDWKTEETNAKRSLILLTDGVVDISKNPEDNRLSKGRIVERILPRLQQNAALTHTIALSDNADRALLEKIAFATGGWSESAKTSNQLQRTFLKMFKKAVPRDSVPLKGNTFSIDSSIKEFSLLVFRKADAKETRLIQPDESVLTKKADFESIQWLHEPGYDLITIKKPLAGEWHFEAETDPDNEVLILTDLKLNVSELPNYVNEKEPLVLSATMTEQGTLIDRADFLDMVEMNLLQSDELKRERDWSLNRKENEFTLEVSDTVTAGKQTFTVTANGKTFQRQVTQTVNVVSNPVTVKTVTENAEGEQGRTTVSIKILADPTLIDIKSMSVDATLTNKSGESIPALFEMSNDEWVSRVKTPPLGERLVVNFDVRAKSLRGNEITPQLKPLIIDGNNPVKAPPPEKVEVAVKKDPPPSAETVEKPADDQAVDWMMTGIIATSVNIVVFVSVFFIFRILKKREQGYQTQLLERLAA